MKFKVEYMGLSDSLFTNGQVYEFDDDDLSISVTRLMKDFVIVEEDVDDVKTVFRVGDTVYFISGVGHFCRGEVVSIRHDTRYPIVVKDNHGGTNTFNPDGKYIDDINTSKTLSFTPYDLINGGFSQNREDIGKDLRVIKEDNSDIKVGDWGYFWDNYDMGNVGYGTLLDIINGKQVTYIDYFGRQWENFSKSIPPHIKEMMENK